MAMLRPMREVSVSPAIALPPSYQPATQANAAIIELAPGLERVQTDDLVEEPMDYTPFPAGHVVAPTFPDEAWTDDDSGPMGF